MEGKTSKNTQNIIKCCLCGKTITGWGNNPWPLSSNDDDRCCFECNFRKVLPARLKLTNEKKNGQKK